MTTIQSFGLRFGTAKKPPADTPKNREAAAKTLFKVFPFDQFAAYLEAEGEGFYEPGAMTTKFAPGNVDGLKDEMIDVLREGEDISVGNIMQFTRWAQSANPKDKREAFRHVQGLLREMGHAIP